MTRAKVHADGLTRCPWPGEDPLYVAYHDTEWGVPEYDDRALYEKLILDGFQAGLAWITILRKRDNFRAAFEGFDPNLIAEWGEAEVLRARTKCSFPEPGEYEVRTYVSSRHLIIDAINVLARSNRVANGREDVVFFVFDVSHANHGGYYVPGPPASIEFKAVQLSVKRLRVKICVIKGCDRTAIESGEWSKVAGQVAGTRH